MKQVKKAPAKKVVEKKAVPAKKVAPVKKAAPKAVAPKAAAPAKRIVSPEERYRMIQDAAYFIAERHGFNGDSAYFWSLAEAEINSKLN